MIDLGGHKFGVYKGKIPVAIIKETPCTYRIKKLGKMRDAEPEVNVRKDNITWPVALMKTNRPDGFNHIAMVMKEAINWDGSILCDLFIVESYNSEVIGYTTRMRKKELEYEVGELN